MQKQNTAANKFLEFNGTNIFFVAANGQYWIALKPICEALNVNWNRQFQNLKSNELLKAVFAIQQIQAPDNQLRNYVALPEFYVYGWLMQIQSESAELQSFQWECYRVLYNYFHGTITGRKELLTQKAKAQLEANQAMNSLTPDNAIKLNHATRKINQITAKLRQLDGEILEEERTLFFNQ